MRIGAVEPAEVGAVTGTRAGDEEAHAGVLRLGGAGSEIKARQASPPNSVFMKSSHPYFEEGS